MLITNLVGSVGSEWTSNPASQSANLTPVKDRMNNLLTIS